MFTEIRCLECVEVVEAGQIDLDNKRAICQACGHSFGFEDKWDSRLRKKRETYLPTGFEMVKSRSKLEISIDPKSNLPDMAVVKNLVNIIKVFQKGFLVVIILFLCFWIVGYSKQEWHRMHSPVDWIGFSAALAVTVAILGFLLWLLFFYKGAKHTLTLTKDQFKYKQVRIGEGNTDVSKAKTFTLPATEVKQVYVRTIAETGMAFQVVIIKTNGEEFLPFGPIANLDHALFLEQEIELFLDIADESISQEFIS